MGHSYCTRSGWKELRVLLLRQIGFEIGRVPTSGIRSEFFGVFMLGKLIYQDKVIFDIALQKEDRI